MNNYFQTGNALETLKNHSVCIKSDCGIRNVKHYTELETELFVMVCNAEKVECDNDTILKGEMVRYFKLSL